MERKILLIILLAAFLIRVPNIDTTLAGDEIDTVGPARNFLAVGETYQYELCDGTKYFNNTHPPFRTVFYSLWAYFFGFSNIAMRIVPLIFGLATIALTYLLGNELHSRKVGLAAAALAAVSRYHIYASQIVTNDNTLYMFLFEAAMYFFVLYKKREDNKFAVLSAAFIVISLYAKLTFFMLVPAMLLFSYLHDKKKIKQDVAIIACAFVAFSASLFAISAAANDPSIFWGPINIAANTTNHESITIFNKVFYLSTITWQLTPFLSLLTIIALTRVKRDKNYWLLAAWIVFPFLAFMSGGGDVQRYYMISLPAIFILLGRFFEKIEWRNRYTLISFAGVAILAALLGLNDLMGYYNLTYVAIFYAAAAAMLILKQRALLLLGAATGLSLYFAFSPGFIVVYGAEAVDVTLNKTLESDIPYYVHTTKDVNFYMTPQGSATKLCEWKSDKNYLLTNATYMAFYHLPDENVVRDIAEICDTPEFIELYDRTIGAVCKIRK